MKRFIKRNRKILILSCSLVLFLAGAGVVQLVMQQMAPFEDVEVVSVETNKNNKTTEIEVLKKPVNEEIGVVRGYYDTNLDDEDLSKCLIYFEGVYRPNLGIDYGNDGKQFDVIASINGTVTKKENDSLLGWVVTVKNEAGLETIYQSLSEVTVEKGTAVKQGDKIGISGENIYESDLKSHLHFVLKLNDKTLNPQTYFDHEVSKIK